MQDILIYAGVTAVVFLIAIGICVFGQANGSGKDSLGDQSPHEPERPHKKTAHRIT